MKIDYAKINDVNGEITVTLEEQDYAEKVKSELKKVAKTHHEPGFRPGHVPAGLIQKKYGNAVKYEVVNREVGNALFDYIKNENLHVLGNPVPMQDEEFDINAKDFTLKFKVGIAPEIDTHVNGELTIPYYTIQVTDEMIDRQDEMFSKRFGKQEPGEEIDATAVVKGEIVELNEDGTVKEGGVVVENGIVSPNHFSNEEQKALFVGKKVGDVIKFNPAATCDSNVTEMSSMLNIDKSDVENHKGDFNFEVKEIIVLKPAEHNEEFFNGLFGEGKVQNEEQYREALKEMIAASLDQDSRFRFSIDAKKAIMDAVGSLELPDEVLKDFLMRQNENLTPENIDAEYEKMLPELNWELIKEAIADQLAIKVEEQDLVEIARMVTQQQMAQYGIQNMPAELVEKYAQELLKEEKAKVQLHNQAMDNKLFNAIRATVNAENKEVTVEEFNDLFKAELEAANA